MQKTKNQNDENWDKNSYSSNISDISANTDVKVFNGVLKNNDNYFSQLNTHNIKNNKTSSQEASNPSQGTISNINPQQNPEQYMPSQHGKFSIYKGNKNSFQSIINKNSATAKQRKFSSAKELPSEPQKYNVDSSAISNTINIWNTKQSIAHSISNEEHLNNTTKGANELLSFRNSENISDSTQNITAVDKNHNDTEYKNSKNGNKNSQWNSEKLLKKFKDYTNEDEEILHTGSLPRSIEPNWKQREVTPVKTMTTTQCSFIVSTIENGIAWLVTNDDCIFTMSSLLWPSEIKRGDKYKLSIEETNQSVVMKQKINLIQRGILQKFHVDDNNKTKANHLNPDETF